MALEIPCPHCQELVEVKGDPWWDLSKDEWEMNCPHCSGELELDWDEDGSGNGWFYFLIPKIGVA